MSRRAIVFAVAALALLAVVLAVFAAPALFDRQAEGRLLRPDDAGLVALGARVYAAQCASCHGVELEGEADWQTPGPDGLLPAPPHDETGHTWHHPDRLLFDITKYGVAAAAGLPDHRSAMPAFEGLLSDREIVAALSYIKSRWPQEVRRRHDALNAQAAPR